MQINDKNTPASFPENELTQMMEAVAQRNRAGGSLPPMRVGVPISATPAPSVRSADMGQPVPDLTGPMTIEERQVLDRMALESGLIRGPVTGGIADAIENADVPYGSLEEAIRAGASVNADDEAIEAAALRHREPTPLWEQQGVYQPIGARVPVAPRHAAREFIAAQPQAQLPRLPDFKKVQLIDLINGKVYVDGLEFELSKEQLHMLRKFSVTIAKEQIQKSLTDALAALDSEDADGGSQAVS